MMRNVFEILWLAMSGDHLSDRLLKQGVKIATVLCLGLGFVAKSV
jgi:hypothetical protein